MENLPNNIEILNVTPDNVADIGVFCIKDKKAPGYQSKVDWFKLKLNKGLKIKIALDAKGKQIGFIEYIPSELAWRPIKVDNFYFIQCIVMFVKEAKGKGIGSLLINQCLQDAHDSKKSGVCAMSSDGTWIANRTLYEKNNFILADQLGRFELMVKTIDNNSIMPQFVKWTEQQGKYKGWHLLYSDQCPWHEKSVTDLKQCAMDHGIKLSIKKLVSPKEAQNAPSGFGTFSLLKDGKLLADHYISKTRFENILKQEERV